MKNNKGFTLVELLATILLLSLIFSISGYYVINIINSSKEKATSISERNIKKSANLYVKENESDVAWKEKNDGKRTTCVSFNELVNKGYLKNNQLENIADAFYVLVTKNKNDVLVDEKLATEEECGNIPKKITIPTSKEYCTNIEYQNKELELKDVVNTSKSNGFMFKTSNTTLKNAGSYVIEAELTDKENNMWKDNTTENKTITCYINKAKPKLEVDPSGGSIIVGEKQTALIKSDVAGKLSVRATNPNYVSASIDNNIISNNGSVTLSMLSNTSNLTTSYITITLSPNDSNYMFMAVTYTISNMKRKKIPVPTADDLCTNPTYNGTTQSLVNKTDFEEYRLVNTKGQDAGRYTVTAVLKYGYVWNDNKIDNYNFECIINQKRPEFKIKSVETTPTKLTDENIFKVTDNKTADHLMKTYKIKITFTAEVPGSITVNNISDQKNEYLKPTIDVASTANNNGEVSIIIEAVNVSDNKFTIDTSFNPNDIKNYTPGTVYSYDINKITTNEFTLTYDNNGGTGCTSKTIYYNQPYGELCSPTRTKYKFIGWYTEKVNGNLQTEDTVLTKIEAKTVYAQWVENYYNISYDLNGGYFGTNYKTEVDIGSVFQLDNPSKSVMTITYQKGSNRDAILTLNGRESGDTSTINSTFAGWTPSNWNANTALYGTSSTNVTTPWGSSTIHPTALYYKNLLSSAGTVSLIANWSNESITLPTIEKKGYTCKYNTKSDGTGDNYASGATYTRKENETSRDLYIICTPNIYTITLNNQSATTAGTTVIYEKYNTGWYSNSNATNEISTITIPIKDNYVFSGYFTRQNGAGEKIINSKGKIIGEPTIDSNITLYARWGKTCIRATTLHTTTCNNLGSWPVEPGCVSSWYNAGTVHINEYNYGDTITFGTLGRTGTLTAGDAFDCDVNDDGVYDSDLERFYYIGKKGSGQNEIVSFIYSYNVKYDYRGKTLESYDYSPPFDYGYDNSNENWHGPRSIYLSLPKEEDWSNNGLILPGTRQITNELGSRTTSGGTIEAFNYTGKSARLLTYQEIVNACSIAGAISIQNITPLELSKCNYFMDNVGDYYDMPSNMGYWLETPMSSSQTDVWTVRGRAMIGNFFARDHSNYGARPVIDVLKKHISY